MELTRTSIVDSGKIAAALGVTDRGVRARANREAWPVARMAGRGGAENMYVFGLLPAEVRVRVSRYVADGAGLGLVKADQAPALPSTANAPDRAKEVGLAKYHLVHAFRKALDAAAWGKKADAAEAFFLAYNSQQLLPNVFRILGPMAEKTVRALDKKLKNAGDQYSALCDGRGGWKKHGTTKYKKRKLPEEAKTAFLQCYCQPTRPSVIMAIRAARMTCEKQGVSVNCDDSMFRRWLKDFSATSAHVICLGRDGMKAYQDQYAPYVTRDSSLLQPGQCLVADGKTLNFFIRHPETGKPVRMTLIMWFDWASRYPVGWQIMPTENTIAIQAAFRCAVLTLGRYPDSVYMDNGRAFKAKIFCETNPDLEELTGLYARIGTAVMFAKPYSGRSKVVERFFLTFQEQVECLMPSFCGDSILNKPAWMARNETFHQAWHEAKTGGFVPTIREAGYVIEKYIQWYSHQPHDGLKGQAPVDVLTAGLGPGVPDDQLRWDFMWRTLKKPRRCRITLWGIEYEADFMHGMARDRDVLVMYDTADLEAVYCYTTDNQYLGEAYPVEAMHPIAKLFGDEVSVDRVKDALKRQARLAKKTKENLLEIGASAEDVLALDVLPWRQKQAVIPQRTTPEKMDRVDLVDEVDSLPEAERARLELIVDEAMADMDVEPSVSRPEYFESEVARYDWAFKVKFEQRLRLSNEDEAFMAYFETTENYQTNYRGRYDDLRMLYGMYEISELNLKQA